MSDVLKDVLTDVVARVVHHVGFEYASSGAIDLLTMILYKYLINVSNSIANIAHGDSFFDIMDGVAILDLVGTSAFELNNYISEVGPYLPEPPEMSIPLAGKVVYFPLQSVNTSVQNQQNNSTDQRGEVVTKSELADNATAQTANNQSSGSSQPQNLRKLPPWARKSTYKPTRISYDWTTGRVIEHRSPSPILAAALPRPITPAARRSARSSTSTFRRPRASPLLVDSDVSADAQTPSSPRPALTADEKWRSALKATLPASPRRTSTLSQSQATVSDAVKPEPHSEASPASISSTQALTVPTTSVVKEAPPSTTKNRNQQSRKKGAANRRRSHPAAARRPVQHVISAKEPPISPSPLDAQMGTIASQSKADTPENRSPVSILGSFDSSPELCPSTSQMSSSKNDGAVSFNRSVSEGTALPPTTPFSYKSPKSTNATNISGGQEGSAKGFVSPHLSVSTPSPYVGVDDRASVGVGEEAVFGGHEDVKSLHSDASTIPMVDEDVPQAPEPYLPPLHFNMRRHPNSVHSGSSSSSSLSSSSSSNSSAASSPLSSPVVDTRKSKAPLPPHPQPPSRQLSSSSASVMSDRPPLRQPPVENPPPPVISDVTALKLSPVTPPPLPPQPPSRSNTLSTPAPVSPRQQRLGPPVSTPTAPPAEPPIRIKIRLAGNGTRENETPTVINSTVGNSADDGESSTSSSSSSSTASSPERISDTETSARRHAAIPPALVARDTRPAILHPPPAFTTATATPTQPGKLVIKFGNADRRASVVRIADSRPGLAQDKLRGSSISSEESSSSSSSSSGSTSDDDEMPNYNAPQQHTSRPPNLPLLPKLTEIKTPAASSSYSNSLPSLQKLNETGGRKLPPQLKPLTIAPPSIPPLPLALHTPPPGSSAPRSSSRGGASSSRNKHLPPVLDPLPSIGAAGPARATTKRSLVDSVFSDDDGEETGGLGNPLPSLGGRRMKGFDVSSSEDARSSIVDTASVHSRGSRSSTRKGAKRRKIKAIPLPQPQAVPVVAQEVIASAAGTSYYINEKGEQIWWCPVCHREDDGSLMICCDSCSDWYHCACLGMTEVTESAWFCPNCAKEQEKRSGRAPHTKKSKKHLKGSRGSTSRH